jgi:hypothetical protein
MTITFQRPATGSKFYYGNFTLGVMVDSHPRFFHLIFAFVFFEVVFTIKGGT